jgi:hypothetical protein
VRSGSTEYQEQEGPCGLGSRLCACPAPGGGGGVGRGCSGMMCAGGGRHAGTGHPLLSSSSSSSSNNSSSDLCVGSLYVHMLM